MNPSGDAAEQVVRLSLEGTEVAVKLTGAGLKNLAVLLTTILREEQKTKGKARLTNMLKTGKELAVFSVEKKDLRKFSKEANRYGVLYCVVKTKYGKDGKEVVDVIARAEDSAKINRIVENYQIGVLDRAKIVGAAEKESPYQSVKEEPKEGAKTEETTGKESKAIEAVEKKPKAVMTKKETPSEPTSKKEPLSDSSIKNNTKQKASGKQEVDEEQNANVKQKADSKQKNDAKQKTDGKQKKVEQPKKESVREKLKEYQRVIKAKEEAKAKALAEPQKKQTKSTMAVYTQPKVKSKSKGKTAGRGGR